MGNRSGRKYLPCTPFIIVAPTSLNDRYKAVQIRIMIAEEIDRIVIRCLAFSLLLKLSVIKKKMRKAINSIYRLGVVVESPMYA